MLAFPARDATSRVPSRQRGINRLILYPGTFNPPHKGHQDLLRYAFANAGEDLHIAAAIILPIEDYRLARKMESKKYVLRLPKAQRVELFKQSGLPKESFWIFEHFDGDWDVFWAFLVMLLSRERIEVKLIMLGGPDWIKIDSAHDPDSWQCRDAITSDISRPVDFLTSSGLARISAYSPWKKVPCDINRLRSQIRAKMRGQSSQGKNSSLPTNACLRYFTNPSERAVIEARVQAAAATIEAAWVCRRSTKPTGFIRFIPAERPDDAPEPPSSTMVRQIIGTCPEETLEAELSKWVLSPELLVRFIGAARERGDLFVQTPKVVEKSLDYSKIKW